MQAGAVGKSLAKAGRLTPGNAPAATSAVIAAAAKRDFEIPIAAHRVDTPGFTWFIGDIRFSSCIGGCRKHWRIRLHGDFG
jgi:hypothetical protein